MERKNANCNLQRYRSKSAKMSENASSIETASAVTVKRPSTALNSSKNKQHEKQPCASNRATSVIE